MKIIDKLNQNKVTLSFEVFPPKTETRYEEVKQAAKQIAALHPDFISITYGAGGGTSALTAKLSHDIKQQFNVDALSHLTCVSSTKAHVHKMVETYQEMGIENILALRGDIPEGGRIHHDYHYAAELIREIKMHGDFCIGAACYPEGHVEARTKREDIAHLKEKVEAGCDFLTTQMFFDNNVFYNFLYRIKSQGIDVPVIAGIMPITKPIQVERAIKLSGCSIPQRFKDMVDTFGHNQKAMQQAGIIYASEQIIDLISNDVRHIHVYTMNNPTVAAGIQANISEIIK